MKIEELAEKIKKGIDSGLPATSSHQKLYSYKRGHVEEVLSGNTHKDSAVLLLMYPHLEELYLVFMLRPVYDGTHSGQICFPGGRMETSDKNLWKTALREAYEELKIKESEVSRIGELSPVYVPPSNFLIRPFLSYSQQRPNFIADKKEVEEIIEIPLKELQKKETLRKSKIYVQQRGELEVKGFHYNSRFIWGATSMILMEFLDVLEKVGMK